MSRFYNLRVNFFAPGNLTTALQDSLGSFSRPIVSCRISSVLGGIGSAEITFPVVSTYGELEQPGNVVIFAYTDRWWPDDAQAMGESYVIQKVETFSTGPESPEMVRLLCVSLLDELTKLQVWRPIGEQSTTNTTVNGAIGAPISTTVGVGAPTNNDAITLTSAAGVIVGDELQVTLNSGQIFLTRVTTVDPPGSPTHTVNILHRLPGSANAGNAVVVRHRRVKVAASASSFLPGAEVVVTTTSGTHTTILDEEPDTDESYVFLRDGLPASVTSGAAITTTNWNQVTTTDVSQIMTFAPDWTSTSTGSAAGTKFAPDGASVFDLLTEVTKATGEVWRMDVGLLGLGVTPLRRIRWIGTSGVSGDTELLTFRVPATIAESSTYSTSVTNNTAIVTQGLRRRGQRERITRVYPFAGDEAITLRSVTPATASAITSAGYTLETDPATLGLYRAPNIYDASAETAIGRAQSRSVNFGGIRSEANAPTSILPAADMLAINSIQYLDAYKNAYREFEAQGCIVNCRVPLFVGQRVYLSFSSPPTNYWAESYSGTNYLYVKSLTIRYGDDTDGIPLYDVVLANAMRPPEDAASTLANRMRTIDQVGRRVTSGGITVLSSVGGSSGSTGDGTGGDHGGLTGLGDDDHLQYVRTSGAGQGLTHNAGIRGFDLWLATDSALTFASGQLKLGTPSTLTSTTTNAVVGAGHTHAITNTSDGQTNVSRILSSSAAGRLRLAGVGLNTSQTTYPLEVEGRIQYRGSSASNELYFTGNHAATIDNNANTITVTSSTLVLDPSGGVVSVDGGITLIGGSRTVQTGAGSLLLTSNGGGVTIDPSSGVLSVDGALSFTGGARSINTISGDLTLEPAGDIEINPTSDIMNIQPTTWIKTTNHTSGHLGAGWGVTYTGEMDMRYLRADELHVLAFIADIARVSVGEHWVTPSMAEISRDFVIPAVSSSGTLFVHDIPGFEDAQAFAPDDYVMIRVLNRIGGGLQAWLAWGQVTNYTNLADAEQSWTFTTRSLASGTAAGKVANAGGIALGLGKSGDGWWRTTAIGNDTPYSEVVTWEGNPYTSGNRRTRMRLGNLKGVTGKKEWGISAGLVDSNKIVFSDLRNEIHGTRLSLYANDQAQARVSEIDIRYTYNGATTADVVPDSDDVTFQAATTGASFFGVVNSGYDTATSASYIYNEGGKSGEVWMGLTNGPSWTTLNAVSYRIRTEGSGFSDDNVRGYVQIFRADQRTPLTSEELFRTYAANTAVGTGTIAFGHVDLNTAKADWDTAWVRIRWEYVATTTPEAVRIDPFVPSLGIGAPLPEGMTAGGTGFWAGREAGVYRLRIGNPTGARLQWTGTVLSLYNSNDVQTIALDSSGNSYFAGPMTIGTNGGIWQGTGTFASPTTGFKIYNSSGIGILRTFNGGVAQIEINSFGYLAAGAGAVVLNADGVTIRGGSSTGSDFDLTSTQRLTFAKPDGSATVGYIGGTFATSGSLNGVRMAVNSTNYLHVIGQGGFHRWYAGADINVFPAGGAGSGKFEVFGNVVGQYRMNVAEGFVAGNISSLAALNGQLVSEISSDIHNAVILRATGTVAHGMTDFVVTETYGTMRRIDANGGARLHGFGGGARGIELEGYAGGPSTATSTTAAGIVAVNALKKSGTGAGAVADAENLFVVRNNSVTRLIVKGNGQLFTDGAASTYDDFDDAQLIRAVDLSLAGQIDNAFGAMLMYNRDDVERAGLASFEDGGVMVNTTRVQRLLMGNAWQQHERMAKQERELVRLRDEVAALRQRYVEA